MSLAMMPVWCTRRPMGRESCPSRYGLAMPTGKTAKAKVTRRRLLDAAATMFAERGYEHTSMRGLGDELGLTSGAVYVHFRNKADLLAATVAEAIAEEVDRPPESGGATYLEGAASLFARHEG